MSETNLKKAFVSMIKPIKPGILPVGLIILIKIIHFFLACNDAEISGVLYLCNLGSSSTEVLV